MSSEKWAQYGWLKPEPTRRDEIRSLLTIVERDLNDANVAGLSEDRRFEAAFSAARTSANIALRAAGYRAGVQAGHHLKTIESLELTIKADAKLMQRMKMLSKKRNPTSYDSAGNVSHQELDLALKTASELRRDDGLASETKHPDLLEEFAALSVAAGPTLTARS